MGIVGFGAFGRLTARHLAPHVDLKVHDPFLAAEAFAAEGIVGATLAEVASCPIVVLAVPVSKFADTLRDMAPSLKPGALVIDVGSVKSIPVEIMRRELPPEVEILGTHPLFGPQSGRNGIRGLNIAVCPVRGRQGRRVAAFLRRSLGLRVIVTTPEAHDREAAMVQGLTHLIAKVMVAMEPLPTRMTTRSYELLIEAIGMVRHDAPEVFQAIERTNPFSADVRKRFFALAAQLDADLSKDAPV